MINMEKYINKFTLAPLFFGSLVLVIWKNTYQSQCYILVFPVIIIGVLTTSFIEYSVKRRECIAQFHFLENSLLYIITRSKFIIIVNSLLISTIIGITFAVSVITIDYKLITLLAVDLFFLVWLYIKIYDAGTPVIKAGVRSIVAKRLCTEINALLIAIIATLLQINSSVPNYIDGKSLQSTMENASSQVSSQCNCINLTVKLNIEKDALMWWSMIKISDHVSDSTLKFIGWTLFLFFNALNSYVFSRYFIQIIGYFNSIKLKGH